MIGVLIMFIWPWAHACTDSIKTLHEGAFKVEVLQYRPSSTKGHIIIVPPTGGTNVLDRSYARHFCAAGFEVSILNHWSEDDEYNLELAIHERFYTRAFHAIDLVVKSLPKGQFVGILGTSVGGLHAAIAASRLSEIQAAFIITGGAHIPSIIANSTQNAMEDAWQKRQKLYGFKTRKEYAEALDKVITLSALDMSGSGKRLGMVIGESDTVVPVENQKKLKALWKPQKVLTFNWDHMATIILTWLFKSDEIVSFFSESLNKTK